MRKKVSGSLQDSQELSSAEASLLHIPNISASRSLVTLHLAQTGSSSWLPLVKLLWLLVCYESCYLVYYTGG